MKNTFLFILIVLPQFLLGQNFEFKIGGSINVSTLYINDVINPDEPTPAEFEEGNGINYSWTLYRSLASWQYSRYRTASPKIGATLNGIGKLKLSNRLSIRTGLEFQYTSFHRTLQTTGATYDYFAEDIEVELHDAFLESTEKIVYFSLPIGLSYQVIENKMSLFGGFMISTVLYDNQVGKKGARGLYFTGGNIAVDPLINEILNSVNFGLSYQINEKFGVEIQAITSLSHVFGFNDEPRIYLEFTAPNEKLPQFNEAVSFLRQGSIGVTYKLF